MMAPDVVAILNQDRADVETVGIRQTPTFFVNGKPLDPFGRQNCVVWWPPKSLPRKAEYKGQDQNDEKVYFDQHTGGAFDP